MVSLSFTFSAGHMKQRFGYFSGKQEAKRWLLHVHLLFLCSRKTTKVLGWTVFTYEGGGTQPEPLASRLAPHSRWSPCGLGEGGYVGSRLDRRTGSCSDGLCARLEDLLTLP